MTGVPRGGEDVPYNLPTEADIELGIEMFGGLGHSPKMADVLDLITSSVNYDEKFKRMWLMLVGNTVIAPTTSNKISPRWYGVLVSTSIFDHLYMLVTYVSWLITCIMFI